MSIGRAPLRYDVFVAPEKPFTAPPPRVGDPRAWDPVTSTLIFGPRDAVLVDALMTVREATVLADWVALHDDGVRDLPSATATPTIAWFVRAARSFPQARAVASEGRFKPEQASARNNWAPARFPVDSRSARVANR